MKVRVKSYVCVSASILKNYHVTKLEKTVCRMEENQCTIVSKMFVHFTWTHQGAANLTQKIKYTCEHIRFVKNSHK